MTHVQLAYWCHFLDASSLAANFKAATVISNSDNKASIPSKDNPAASLYRQTPYQSPAAAVMQQQSACPSKPTPQPLDPKDFMPPVRLSLTTPIAMFSKLSLFCVSLC